MSKNVFDQIGDIRNNINRNNFDWSKTNNFTTALGRITPVYCELCPPNSSLKIKPQFGLRFMPMMFPVQTNMKSYLSFYRVPLRTLWKDFKDWVSSPNDQSSTLEPPYIGLTDSCFGDGKMFGVSGLADYLGIPVSSFQGAAQMTKCTFSDDPVWLISDVPTINLKSDGVWYFSDPRLLSGITEYKYPNPKSLKVLADNECYYRAVTLYKDAVIADPDSDECEVTVEATFTMSDPYLQNFKLFLEAPYGSGRDGYTNGFDTFGTMFFGSYSGQQLDPSGSSHQTVSLYDTVPVRWKDVEVITSYPQSTVKLRATLKVKSGYCIGLFAGSATEFFNYSFAPDSSISNPNTNATSYGDNKDVFLYQSDYQFTLSPETCPYYLHTDDGKNKNRLKLSAYPFRAYEAVYNAYLRNIKNNPFKINGKVKYNTWIPTDEGGEDIYAYDLHFANWASDMFTTAVPSPQQGQAPLVGITTYTNTVTLENGHTQTELKTAVVDEEGNKYAVSFENNDDELKNVNYRLLDQNTPVQQVNSLYDLVTSGISINDFRNVNAYQRYLELNQMRGYSYKEIIDGRFDVNVKYCDLLMPEYLGGCTRDIQMNAITQTVETSDAGTYQGALGSQAGNATLFAGSEDISVFCDEESIVIGILSVVPMPVYTQNLPKYFLYRDRLDSFTPEFDHIGFQPIKMSEVSPVLQFQQDAEQMDKVFGYQRPWYEYVQKLDTASGLFRTQLRNFLINRVFQIPPQLNSAFTTVDPRDVNDVFSVTETTDKILGQIYFDVVAKLPISRVSVPKLE